MFVVMVKEKLVNVRLSEQTHQDFKIACELRGASMSSFLHQFIVRTVREEKEASPQSFRTQPRGVKAATMKVTRQEPKRKTG